MAANRPVSGSGRVGRSVAWSTGGGLLMRFGQLLVGIVVARLLAPADFGVFAVVLAVYAVIVNISEAGVGSALIREEEDRLDTAGPTAVTMALVSSAALAAVMFSLAPLLAATLGAPQASDAIRVMTLVVVLAGPAAVPAALLTRAFRQDLRFSADLVNFVIANLTVVVLAMNGHGVMALVWSRVLGQLASVLVLIAVSPRRYAPGFDRSEARSLLRFGLPLTGANLIGYTIGNIDVATIGRMAGPVPLGTFSLASNVASWPLSLFSTVLINVGLPVLSKVRHDAATLTRYLANAMSAISFASLYVAAMCASLAQPLVVSLYGQKWAAAGGVLAVLGIYGAVRVFLALVFDALVACNATTRLLVTQLLWIVVLVPAMIAGVATGGVQGAAVAHVLVSALAVLPFSLIMLRRAAGVPLLPLLAATVLPAVAAVVAGLAAHVAAGTVDSSWTQLGVGSAAGTAVYAALTWHGGQRVIGEIRILYRSGSGPADDTEEPSPRPGGVADPVQVGATVAAGTLPTPATLLVGPAPDPEPPRGG